MAKWPNVISSLLGAICRRLPSGALVGLDIQMCVPLYFSACSRLIPLTAHRGTKTVKGKPDVGTVYPIFSDGGVRYPHCFFILGIVDAWLIDVGQLNITSVCSAGI